MRIVTKHSLRLSFSFAGIWLLAWLLYQPGLAGPFLFDDTANLEKIGALGPVENWELLRAYLNSGFSGPTGRPLSLASFLIDANDWPAEPAPFKRTNVLIHLLIATVLFSVIRKILLSIQRFPMQADWIALVAATLWLLNPFLVSTTLYVVQRMTQLSALFSILGIWGYLQGRLWLPSRPRIAYTTMSLSVVLGTLLAVFSKENGALLPLLILTLEVALRFHWTTPGPSWRWKTAFLGLPALAVIVYLGLHLPDFDQPIPTRGFSVSDRLLTEPRILWDYLFHLFVPHIQTRGLYQDGISISTQLSSPWTTAPALFALIALTVGGWLARRRWPLFGLAILFFVAGHLLESTTIALELYFEHRNYLPSMFLFLPIAAGILELGRYVRPPLISLLATFVIGTFAVTSWQGARLWGDETQLMLVWAENNPNSPRAQVSAARTWLRLGQPELAFSTLERASRVMPNSAILTGSYLAFKAELGTLNATELSEGAAQLRRQPFDAQLLKALERLVESINAHSPLPEHTAITLSLLEGIRSDLAGRVPVADRFTFYLQGVLLSGQGNAESAYSYFTSALSRYRSVDSGLQIVSILATHGHFEEALGMLEQSKRLLGKLEDSDLRRSRRTYEQEIERLRISLIDDLGKRKPTTFAPETKAAGRR